MAHLAPFEALRRIMVHFLGILPHFEDLWLILKDFGAFGGILAYYGAF
jgi:hypothetical protein